MANALTIYGEFDTLQRAAMALHESGYFVDSKSEAQAIVKVMAGAELGLPPFAAMTGIHIIQGKPALGANVIATLIKNDPRYDYRVTKMDDAVCEIAFFENGEQVGVSSFTAQDAKRAGTKNMDKFPRNMLFARAISNGARWYTPGIFGGAPVYTPEELGADVDEDGYIVDVTPRPAPRQAPQIAETTEAQWDDLPSASEAPKQAGNGRFWQTVCQKIPYFNAPKHAEATADLLGIGYPDNKDEATAYLLLFEQYANLRADGMGQDEAIAKVTGRATPATLFGEQLEIDRADAGAYAD